MFYTIVLQRKSEHKDIKKLKNGQIVGEIEDSTLGVLSVYEHQDETSAGREILNFFTCENIGPSTDTPKQDKRIIAREYQLEWTNTCQNASLARTYPQWKAENNKELIKEWMNDPKFINTALWLKSKDLPSFAGRRILIHVGNYPQDTKGCILLGKSKGNGTVHNSIEACKDFFDFVKKVGIENIRGLVVREIKG
ncbi:hypothetical protein LS68_009290 [Helicobacter sp. MIT 05-5293]|uniref:DUF5675 family protein n=1 Tax=unclassified Helicobacter TaxID=2593540 RepID=UPI00051D231D|nr:MULTISPECIES: DUF5675 family protein [unclassified Helicobacter]TLD79853.1 hypothetical protein LS68_009290 [Helicobacter sp. MIT 05-5293]TLD85526.1 hypothetical protein LS69_009040 [Helicobacter sp. MIT 05-5294]